MFIEIYSIEAVLQLTVIFLSIGMIISNLEFVYNHQLFTSEGILDWKILQVRWRKGRIKKLLSFLFKQKLILPLFVSRLILWGCLLLAPPMSYWSWGFMLSILGTHLITNLFTFYGSDGSDQMNLLILITLCLCAIPFGTTSVIQIGVIFIAIQSCFSYFVAGFSKLLSMPWRKGEAVREIFKTRTYGSEKVYNYLKGKKGLNLFLCWSVIILECLFPLVLFLPLEIGGLFLIWGISFHLLNALIMGLNTFFWAFLASYPSIIFVNLVLIN